MRGMGGGIDPACLLGRSLSQQQRDQGKAHQAPVRALACTWIASSIAVQDPTPYDAATSLQALHRRGSSLMQNLAKAPEKL